MAGQFQLDPFEHVKDYPYFEVPHFLGGQLHLPEIFGFPITKYMVLQVVAGLLTLFIFRGLAKRIQSGDSARGAWWNFWELLAVFIRDEVVRPTIGTGFHAEHHGHGHEEHWTPNGVLGEEVPDTAHGEMQVPTGEHPADRYLPFIWTCFFYILFCNLLGMFPWLGSPTANINVTGPLAVTAFGMVILSGSQAMGPLGFWKGLVPEMGVSGLTAAVLVPFMWVIEVLGLLIRHSVLAVRLFANIFGGHTSLGVLLAFVGMKTIAASWLWYPVAASSILGQAGISLLELLFAFIQAYIFVFLTTVFISMAIHPH